jgi:hypothetical protein
MFRYLVVAQNRAHLLLEEDSGRILHRTREFLQLLQDNFPDIVFRPFRGRPNQEFVDLDLIYVVPLRPEVNLLNHLIAAYGSTLQEGLDESVRLSLPRRELHIELAGRGKKGKGTATVLANTFETTSKRLVAVLRRDAIDPAWVRGIRARVTRKTRFAFFIARREDVCYRGKRGTVHHRAGLQGDLDNR